MATQVEAQLQDWAPRVPRVADLAQVASAPTSPITHYCFDEEPLPDLDSEAIDFRAASELFAPLRRLTARDLADEALAFLRKKE